MASRNAASSSASYSARAPLTALTAGTATPAFHGAMLHRAEHGGRLRPGSREHPCRLRLLESDEAAKCPGGRGLPGRRTRGEYRPGLGSEVAGHGPQESSQFHRVVQVERPILGLRPRDGYSGFRRPALGVTERPGGIGPVGRKPACRYCLPERYQARGRRCRKVPVSHLSSLIPVPLPVSTVLRPGTPRQVGEVVVGPDAVTVPGFQVRDVLSPRCASSTATATWILRRRPPSSSVPYR